MQQIKWTGRKHFEARVEDLLSLRIQYHPMARTYLGVADTWALRKEVHFIDERPRWVTVDFYHSLEEAKAAAESIAKRWTADAYRQDLDPGDEWDEELFWGKNSKFWGGIFREAQEREMALTKKETK